VPAFSKDLEQGLHRALVIANDHSHEYATLEHLLLALTEDPDGLAVMEACGVKVDLLRENLIQYIDTELTDRKSTRLNSSHSQQSRMPSSA